MTRSKTQPCPIVAGLINGMSEEVQVEDDLKHHLLDLRERHQESHPDGAAVRLRALWLSRIAFEVVNGRPASWGFNSIDDLASAVTVLESLWDQVIEILDGYRVYTVEDLHTSILEVLQDEAKEEKTMHAKKEEQMRQELEHLRQRCSVLEGKEQELARLRAELSGLGNLTV
jgi:predicted RecB family endonuclease